MVQTHLERVWNSAAVVLGTRQRVCQFAEDVWTRLWGALNSPRRPARLHVRAVLDKLSVSLHCYQVRVWNSLTWRGLSNDYCLTTEIIDSSWVLVRKPACCHS